MGTWLYLGDADPWTTAWVNCAYCPPQKRCATPVQVGRAGCRGIPVEGVEFVVLHIVEMSFLGFSKFWDTSGFGEQRKNTLQTGPGVCSGT